ncbi:NAD(P)-dependent oxidoreductase [Maribacter sp. 2210JD10-5]|uniref:NAD(P)-dependent oxidoreductase n=1 Tax=Maribacter sp. 2210JD10-5 TaxID=3386272 RepID=UPI0039BD3215
MEKIGFIGLGIMGKPMAMNLLKAGYPMVVYNRTASKADALKEAGAEVAAAPKEVAEQVDVVISIVSDTPDVEKIALGEDGIIHGVKNGMLYIDMSSVEAAAEIEIGKKLQEKGVDMLDAPVSGGDVGAENGNLSIMVGGSEKAFARAKPIFEVLGRNINHIGDLGAGQITKSCNQIATALATQGVIEALTLAKKAGVDTAKVRQAMLGGFASSKALDIAGGKMIERNFAPGFKTVLYRKDLNIALQTGKSLAVPLNGTSLVASEMDALLAQGKGEEDFSALLKIIEQLAAL